MGSSLRAGILSFLFCLFQAPSFAQQVRLAGTWENYEAGVTHKLILQTDGSGVLDGEALHYKVEGSLIIIATANETLAYTYQIQGNQLTVSGGDMDAPMVFLRAEAKAGSKEINYSNTAGELLGTWSGEGEVIEFRPEGICRYNETLIPYRLSQGHVLLETTNGVVTFAYTVKGNRLVLTANGQQALYNRMPAVKQAPSASKQGKNPSDLVGQWCYLKSSTGTYSGRCITLNANGTYTYTEERSMSVQTEDLAGGTSSQGTDSGTWYVLGDRLYYQSTTHGSGSYRLERRNHPKNVNDPMIVLDDEPFVTTTRRPPWR